MSIGLANRPTELPLTQQSTETDATVTTANSEFAVTLPTSAGAANIPEPDVSPIDPPLQQIYGRLLYL